MNDLIDTLDGPPGTTFYYVRTALDGFDPILFDEHALSSQNLLKGTATAGRGNTFFFEWADKALVLRHYRRGGMVRHISNDLYFYSGIKRTRALREFDVMLRLQLLQLPAARPCACRVIRYGAFYSASLVSYRLAGVTLAERLKSVPIEAELWENIGKTIARFHQAGLYHADLNAHNIIIDDNNAVFLIDFDRAEFRNLPSDITTNGWCIQNVHRLKRSLSKIANRLHGDEVPIISGFQSLNRSWAGELKA